MRYKITREGRNVTVEYFDFPKEMMKYQSQPIKIFPEHTQIQAIGMRHAVKVLQEISETPQKWAFFPGIHEKGKKERSHWHEFESERHAKTAAKELKTAIQEGWTELKRLNRQ